ncbi:NAD(P)/FAD-dependent oxidoreductase [Aestuariimicrobium kwangyangense]|uniref:NAD(P)/FAD-dependent oxidoreductase n=1 Tax=Aestuariimicrobium kwangyangense TaxID=396389 RepID=UPI0003B5DA4D|nr:FAD-dependent oxidoreductase [Aestuariimicrobium kwangyangense]
MSVVIIGAGLAGASVATELRERGDTRPITLIGAEPHLPYERPPLSKDLLLGKQDAEAKAFVHDDTWYSEHDVELLTDTTVHEVDLDAAEVVLPDGRRLAFDQLVLATGSSPRPLPMADDSGAPVAYLRTLDDAHALLAHLPERVAIIGGGWIGLEVAAAVQQAGGQAIVLVRDALPLQAVLGNDMAQVFADLHREHGVDLRTGVNVTSISSYGQGAVLTLDDKSQVEADLVLVGIGAEPNVDLARGAGLKVDDGVLVDAHLRTSDPKVFAIGDIANHDHPRLGRLRVEHWDTALQQGKYVARQLTGDDSPYERQPYFFTDQYDLGMEYVGRSKPDDQTVVTGDRAARTMRVLWVRDGTVVAGMHLNDWDATSPLKQAIGRRVDDVEWLDAD